MQSRNLKIARGVKDQSKVESEDLVAGDVDQISDEPVLITDECHITALVCDQPVYEKEVLDQDKIQPIQIATPSHESVVVEDIVGPVLDMPKVEGQVLKCAISQPLVIPLQVHEPVVYFFSGLLLRSMRMICLMRFIHY